MVKNRRIDIKKDVRKEKEIHVIIEPTSLTINNFSDIRKFLVYFF